MRRPPRVEPTSEHVVVESAGVVLADTHAAWRVLETSHPPSYYLPRTDVRTDLLTMTATTSWCEFKGKARYYALSVPDGVPGPLVDVCWSYLRPSVGFEVIAGAIAFYPGRVDACWVAGEQVRVQEGDFYGGWITSRVCGPFKGGAGTRGW